MGCGHEHPDLLLPTSCLTCARKTVLVRCTMDFFTSPGSAPARPHAFLLTRFPPERRAPEVFAAWFRNFVEVRDEEGAERCLATAIEVGVSREEIASMIFAAATDHVYIDGWSRRGFRQQGLRTAGSPGLGDGRPGSAEPGAWNGAALAAARSSASGAIPSISPQWSGKRGRDCLVCLAGGHEKLGSWNEADSLASEDVG